MTKCNMESGVAFRKRGRRGIKERRHPREEYSVTVTPMVISWLTGVPGYVSTRGAGVKGVEELCSVFTTLL